MVLETTPKSTTLILAIPGDDRRLAGTVAVSSPLPIAVVLSGIPFHCTVPPFRLLPLTEICRPVVPATAEAGEMKVIVGGGRIVKIEGEEETPNVATVTFALPGMVKRFDGTVA